MNRNKFASILIIDGSISFCGFQPTRYVIGSNGRELVLTDSSYYQSVGTLVGIIDELRRDGFTRIAVGVDSPYPSSPRKVMDAVSLIPGVEFVSNSLKKDVVDTNRYKDRDTFLMDELGHRRSKF